MNNRKHNLAAIDAGTNSFHLIVVRVDARTGQFKIINREKEFVRLGEGSTDMKHISHEAMSRGLATLKRFKRVADGLHASIRAIGTSAIREALNKKDFLQRVEQETGIRIEVASGIEEARLIYLGILQALPVYTNPLLLIDVGGGSTEFLVGKKGKVLFDHSLKLGAVRLTDRFFRDSKGLSKKIRQCREFIRGTLHPVVRELQNIEYQTIVGTSGTIQNVAKMIFADKNSENAPGFNSYSFTRKELKSITEKVIEAADHDSLGDLDGLDPARHDIIVAGTLIIEQLFEQLNLQEMTISQYGMREGIILDTIEKRYFRSDSSFEDFRREGVIHLAEMFSYEKGHSQHVTRLALRMFDQLGPLHRLGSADRELLKAASILHEVGLFVSHSQHHRHSYYLIRNAELLGFTENEKEVIANIARYHRKSHPKPKHENFQMLSREEQTSMTKLAAILRIADGLDRGHTSSIADIVCRRRGKSVVLYLQPANGRQIDMEIWGANRKKDLFEETFGVDVRLVDNASTRTRVQLKKS
jgi:exopolyphosphatase/guanosine-5'-triphosphate,3'-diphosphate pyrophosphatase